MQSMKIYLIRHGETTGDIEDRYGGDYEDHLTEKGKQQSKELSQKLKGKGIEIVYHSPRIRATETANIIAQALGLDKEIVQDLRERNAYGILTGLTKKEALEKYPAEIAELKRDKKRHKVKNSEDYDHFKERVTKALDEVTKNEKYSTIAIITHGGPISCIVREILKAGELKKLGDCAILELKRKDNNYQLISMDGAELED
ncbi:hypothetical protein GF343_03335 [Candidatus Woesearchaeota archaeon]|nr:hypothetical protein [Candidatus Woesearchaeota archaeon]